MIFCIFFSPGPLWISASLLNGPPWLNKNYLLTYLLTKRLSQQVTAGTGVSGFNEGVYNFKVPITLQQIFSESTLRTLNS